MDLTDTKNSNLDVRLHEEKNLPDLNFKMMINQNIFK